MIAAPAAAESRTTAAGPMAILNDAAPLLLMAEGVADADELDCDALAEAEVTGVTVDAVPGVPVLELVDMDMVDIDDVEAVVIALTAKSPLCA